MIIRKIGLVLGLFVLSLGANSLALADFEKGLEAYDQGDYKTALKEWLVDAEQGDAKAQYFLYSMYTLGQGVTKDSEQANYWLKLSAENGDDRAQNSLAHTFTFAWPNPDYKEAVKWWRLSAEQGNKRAQYFLGEMYDRGKGVQQDKKEAFKWYSLAANQGLVLGQYNVGVMYANGEGVRKDNKQALKWYKLAAEQGYDRAQNNLGFMYSNGLGVPQNYILSHMWFNLAASRGNETAAENRDKIAKKMTSEQIAEAQMLSAEWVEEHQ